MHACMHVCMLFMYVCMHACMYVFMYGCMDGWMYAWTNTYVCIHVRMHVFIYRESESERDGSKRERAYMDNVHEMMFLLKTVAGVGLGELIRKRNVWSSGASPARRRLSEALQGGDAHKWVQQE